MRNDKKVEAESPRHVAIIMDGNGRWAQARGKPRLFGHHAGAKRVREIVEACPDLGVKYLTVFAFSTENWKRTQTEVSGLMSLFKRYITRETQNLITNGVRVRFIGDRMKLDHKLVALMDELELLTAHNDTVHLTIALNYGGRDEVARATKRLAREVAAGRIDPETVDGETLARFLDAGAIDELHLMVAPIVLGSGKTGLNLAPIQTLDQALRPDVRTMRFKDGDMLCMCDMMPTGVA